MRHPRLSASMQESGIVANIKLKNWLTNELSKRGISQSELARRSGVPRQTINGIMNETRGVGPDVLNALAHGLNLPSATLFKAAGILDATDLTSEEEELLLLFRGLSATDRKELVDLARFKLDRRGK